MLATEKIALKRKQDLGQYFTPSEVVDLAYDFLEILLQHEPEKWHQKNGKQKYPSIIDPACGEGIFLKKALEREITLPKYVFGVDVDEHVVERWKQINLLKSFGSEAELNTHFFHQNGLCTLSLDPKKYPYIKSEYSQNELFDIVVGNPPYGGIGVEFGNLNDETTKELLRSLQQFEIIRLKAANVRVPDKKEKQNGETKPVRTNGALTLFEPEVPYNSTYEDSNLHPRKVAFIAQSLPIEVLFIEKFIKLCKPGGHIAIIVPDGILANGQMDYLRQWISSKIIINVVLSLPRDTFKHAKTSAKTSLLILTKKDENFTLPYKLPVFIASIKKYIKMDKVREVFKKDFSDVVEYGGLKE